MKVAMVADVTMLIGGHVPFEQSKERKTGGIVNNAPLFEHIIRA